MSTFVIAVRARSARRAEKPLHARLRGQFYSPMTGAELTPHECVQAIPGVRALALGHAIPRVSRGCFGTIGAPHVALDAARSDAMVAHPPPSDLAAVSSTDA